jgi:hypothetical protein
VIASDGELSDSLLVTVHVYLKNAAPEITSPAKVIAYESMPFQYNATAIDEDEDPVSLSFKSYPIWLKADSAFISGTLSASASDTSFIIVASDGNLSDALKVLVKVIRLNYPPKISGLTDFIMHHDEIYTIKFLEKVQDPDDPANTHKWRVITQCPNLKIELRPSSVKFAVSGYMDSAEVKFQVTDPAGASESTTLLVKVTYPAGVTQATTALPDEFSLAQSYPNPFNPETTIRYALPKDADLTIVVFDLEGRVAAELWHGKQKAGYHTLRWNEWNIVILRHVFHSDAYK